MSDRWAVVRDGQIQNVIIWDGQTDYDPGDDATLVLEADAVAQGIPPVPVEAVSVEETATVDPAVLDNILDNASKATTIAGLKAALLDLVADLKD